MKQNKIIRILELADLCRIHGGPVNDKTLHLLSNLTKKQLLLDVSFLKATIAKEV